MECHFFPNPANEIYVVNMLRTCRKTLDVAIFTLTNDRIAAAIEEAFNRGVKVRIIADDECCKMMGSDVTRLASLGIDVKTDNSIQFHMHHKFGILDNSVVVTGSFNWTSQAVKSNQENILFFENKAICEQYTTEYEKLWNQFTTVITKEIALKSMEEEAKKKSDWNEKRKLEKEENKGKPKVEKEKKTGEKKAFKF